MSEDLRAARRGGRLRSVVAVSAAREHPSTADARRLAVALVLIAAFMVAEVAVAILASSLALLADAGHMLTDAGALGGSLWALHLAAKPARGRWTFGFQRAEI